MSWNILTNVGNPTKSIEINDLIKGRHNSNVYNDVDLPYPDAKVAGRL
jgi:hypothetical protein